MNNNFARQLIKQAFDLIALMELERRPNKVNTDKAKISQRIAKMRNSVMTPPSPAGNPTLDAFNDIQVAIGELDLQIAAEAFESATAKTPEERAKAELRASKLAAQRERLMQQLAMIKVRLLNESGKKLKI